MNVEKKTANTATKPVILWKSLTRQEITEETTLIDGENLNRYFDELLHFYSVSVKNLGIYLETISSYQKRTVEQ